MRSNEFEKAYNDIISQQNGDNVVNGGRYVAAYYCIGYKEDVYNNLQYILGVFNRIKEMGVKFSKIQYVNNPVYAQAAVVIFDVDSWNSIGNGDDLFEQGHLYKLSKQYGTVEQAVVDLGIELVDANQVKKRIVQYAFFSRNRK